MCAGEQQSLLRLRGLKPSRVLTPFLRPWPTVKASTHNHPPSLPALLSLLLRGRAGHLGPGRQQPGHTVWQSGAGSASPGSVPSDKAGRWVDTMSFCWTLQWMPFMATAYTDHAPPGHLSWPNLSPSFGWVLLLLGSGVSPPPPDKRHTTPQYLHRPMVLPP